MMRQRCRFWPAMRPLALLSVIVPASAVAADPLPISSPYLELIRDPAVHVELGLRPQQIAALRRVTDELDPALWRTRNQPHEQALRGVARLIKPARSKVKTILDGPQQMRIEQVELQWQGLRAVLRPEVGNRLALTTVQIAGIRGMVAETDRMIARVRKQSREDKGRRAIEKQVKSMRKSESRRIHGRLNASQKLDWEKMIGRSFDLSRLGKGMKYKAPTLAGSTRWVNGSPTTRAALRGKVVVVHFYALA